MSGFVSAGTDTGEAPAPSSERDEAWQKAQEQIEATRQAKSQAGKQEEGKTLYETLQANKAAKQDAFEESIRLRNQFRSLDEDEVEFLDSVLESTRAKEAEVKKQTIEQLDAFRRQQEDAEREARRLEASAAEPVAAGGEAWAPRKRKKGRESGIGGVKIRRTSSAVAEKAVEGDEEDVEKAKDPHREIEGGEGSGKPREAVNEGNKGTTTRERREMTADVDEQSSEPKAPDKLQGQDSSVSKSASPPGAGLGLAAYSSDEDED